MEIEDSCENYVFEYNGLSLIFLENIIIDNIDDILFLYKDPKFKFSINFSEQDEINLK
jgi:hypothetical protein